MRYWVARKTWQINYGNLGNLYETCSDLDKAEVMYEKSLKLFQTIDSPKAEIVEHQLLDLRKHSK